MSTFFPFARCLFFPPLHHPPDTGRRTDDPGETNNKRVLDMGGATSYVGGRAERTFRLPIAIGKWRFIRTSGNVFGPTTR